MPDKPTYIKRAHPGKWPMETANARTPKRRGYAELQCHTNFSFLRGASHPEELAEQAAALGYEAIAITDRHTLAGVVRMHCAAKACGIKLIVGAEFLPSDATPVLLYAMNRGGYGNLCRIITEGRLRSKKGECRVTFADIAAYHEGLLAVVPGAGRRDEGEGSRDQGIEGSRESDEATKRRSDGGGGCHGQAQRRRVGPHGKSYDRVGTHSRPYDTRTAGAYGLGDYDRLFGDRIYLASGVHAGTDDAMSLARAYVLSRETGIPLIATNDVHYHVAERRFLQDVLTCIRERCTLPGAGKRLFANAERHLKPIDEIERIFTDYPEAVARTVQLADRCTFSLDELCYEYPEALCPPDRTPHEYLTELTRRGAAQRYPDGVPKKVHKLIEHELQLIRELSYEPYFLTVWDIVNFARSRDILCQGRGSAANSVVCYCLGITSVDPDRIDLLFERFVSAERNEPPDIDVDFEHERREEVFQYIYGKYGREHAGIVAEVITYRPRSAIRDVGKALGLSLDRVALLAKKHEWWDQVTLPGDFLQEVGFDPKDRTVRMLAKLVRQIVGFPRHLSQHVGGFVITRGPLCEMVPLQNGAMPGRTFIEWDKDDIDALGILKIDCLALGMLTAIRKCFRLLAEYCKKGSRDQGIEGSRKSDGEWALPTLSEGSRDQGIKGSRETTGVNGYGEQGNISRSDRVAKSDLVDQGHLSNHPNNAGDGKIRLGHANATSSRFGREQHCGGERTTIAWRLSSLLGHGARVTGGTGNTGNHLPRSGDGQRGGTRDGNDSGDTPNSSRSHGQPTKKTTGRTVQATANEEVNCADRPSIPRSLDPLIPSSLHEVPAEDPAVYDMICRADTVGVFQIESRAQMSMLPRLKPRCFYDLVIEVAIVRPGPIQGGMVHPYLRRRSGEELVTYPSEAIKKVLKRTLGVPLFQEQAMRLAVVAAGFTPGEADQLRRAMGAWRKNGDITRFRTKLIDGMRERGLSEEFAERCFKQICGFGEYGFPESHAASFALLVYVSCWLKRYHPAGFCAAILNAQPMGFYQPAQLVRDAREHGVVVLGVDVNRSAYDCRLVGESDEGTEGRRDGGKGSRDQGIEGSRGKVEKSKNQKVEIGGVGPSEPRAQASGSTEAQGSRDQGIEGSRGKVEKSKSQKVKMGGAGRSEPRPSASGQNDGGDGCHGQAQRRRVRAPNDDPSTWGVGGPALRFGMRLIRGISRAQVESLEAAQRDRPFTSVADLARRSGAARVTLFRLAAADAMRSLGLDRRQAAWEVLALGADPQMFEEYEPIEPTPDLPEMSLEDTVREDYSTIGLSLAAHPMSLIRNDLARLGAEPTRILVRARHGQQACVAGMVLVRQRPSTASGVVFCTLEDETGIANLIIRPQYYEKYRRTARGAAVLIAKGRVERQGEVVHLNVTHLIDASRQAPAKAKSRDFH